MRKKIVYWIKQVAQTLVMVALLAFAVDWYRRPVQPAGMADNPNDSRRTMAAGFVKKGQRLWAGTITSGDQVFVNRLAWNFTRPSRDDVVVFATSAPELAFGIEGARALARRVC